MFQLSAARRSSFKSWVPVMAIALTALVPAMARTSAAAAPVESPTPAAPIAHAAAPALPTEKPAIQVADEIIRRLRRLGINVNPARLPRPYDGEGELC
jgi:hypothetical protein